MKAGGLARRAAAVAALTREYGAVLLVDNGNLAMIETQYEPFATAMQKMGYVAVNTGMEETRKLEAFTKAMARVKIPILGSSAKPVVGMTPMVEARAGGLRVAIVGFSAEASVGDEGAREKQRLELLADARKRSDLLVVLSQLGRDRDSSLLKGMEATPVDLLIGGLSWGTPSAMTVQSGASIPPISTKGKSLGVIEVTPAKGSRPSLKLRQVLLDENYPLDPEIDKLVKAYYTEETVPPADKPGMALNGRHTPVLTPSVMMGGSGSCRVCHAKQAESWAKSGHAKALRTLQDAGKLVPECLSCHSQSYRSNRVYRISASGPSGVDCAACHADTPAHGAAGPPKGSRVKSAARCVGCHSAEHSPKFDLEAYWGRIVH